MQKKYKFPILGIFFLGVSFLFSNFCYGQTTQRSSLQQKAMTPQPVEKQSVQPEKIDNPNNSNKLITIEGNPHPQNNYIDDDNKVVIDSTKNNFQISRLSVYEKMLKQYELEKVENKSKEGEVEIIDSRIYTLKAMISFEKNKKSQQAELSDLPKYINTGNLELDIKNYEDAKRAWIKNYPKEYQKISQNRRMPGAIEIDNLLKYREN